MMLSDVWRLSVCLSRTSGLSREQNRPRKTKIGTEVARVTRDSDTTFNVKRSKVKVTGGGGIVWRPATQLVISVLATNFYRKDLLSFTPNLHQIRTSEPPSAVKRFVLDFRNPFNFRNDNSFLLPTQYFQLEKTGWGSRDLSVRGQNQSYIWRPWPSFAYFSIQFLEVLMTIQGRLQTCIFMPPPLGRGIKPAMMRVWRLSVAYIGPKSRTETPRKTEIGTDVAHVTRDSDTTFKVKRSKVNLQGRGHIVAASRSACWLRCRQLKCYRVRRLLYR